MPKSVLAFAMLLAAASAARALTPKAEAFVRESGLDPASAAVRWADKEGTIVTILRDEEKKYSLESLAIEGKKLKVIDFVACRWLVRNLKADFAGTPWPPKGLDITYTTMEERKLAINKAFDHPPMPTPEAQEYLKSIGVDPASEDVGLAHQAGEIQTTYMDEPVTYSLEALALAQKKTPLIRFVATRGFIANFKYGYIPVKIPGKDFEPDFLTPAERALIASKPAAPNKNVP